MTQTDVVAGPLDDQLCFALYSAANATTQAYREVLCPWNLTYTQYLALVVLATGERRVSDLGRELGLDSGTLSPLLKRLQARGLVTRRRAPDDERVVVASLTESGRRTRDVIGEAVGCLVPPLTASGFDVTELIAGLTRITAQLQALTTQRRRSH